MKKMEVIKDYLSNSYNLQIKNYEKTEFKPLPLPTFEIKNAIIQLKSSDNNFNIKNLIYILIF